MNEHDCEMAVISSSKARGGPACVVDNEWHRNDTGKKGEVKIQPAISQRNTRCVALADKDFLVVDR